MENQGTIFFIAVNRNESSTLKGREYPPAEIIDTVDEIVVEKKGGKIVNELIRYKPGESSIYLKEQSGQYDNDGKIKKHGEIILINGFLAVSPKEVLLLGYLRACNANAGNKNRMPGRSVIFKERDEAKEADAFLEEEKADRGLLTMIDKLEANEVEAFALILGDTRADQKKTSEVRRDLIIYAKANPKKFRKGIKDVNLARKVHVIKAFKDGFINYDEKNNIISWEDGKEITRCPIGKDPADHLVELSFTPDFETVYASIQERLDGTQREKVKVTSNTRLESDRDLAIAAMKDSRVFEKRGMWYGLADTKEEDEYHNVGRGENEITSKIEVDDKLKGIIRKRLYEPVE